MRYALNAFEMKQMDTFHIEQLEIPSMVLMERAALCVVKELTQFLTDADKIAVVCGGGNNGGDGAAIGRILHLQGRKVTLIRLEDMEKCSRECRQQFGIAERLHMNICTHFNQEEYTIIIDAIFGIGLSRDVTGRYLKVIENINASKLFVISVDIPSGIHASDGGVMGAAVKAAVTVTFGEMKLGLLFYPGAEYAGKVLVHDIGCSKDYFIHNIPEYSYYEEQDLERLPVRIAGSNKGSYGRVLIIAGSRDMTGAAYLSAAAAYRMGAGLVKVLTAKAGQLVLQSLLPEALCTAYDTPERNDAVMQSLAWADAVVIGPGLSQSEQARELLTLVLSNTKVPTLLDADALNIIAARLTEEGSHTVEQRINALKALLPPQVILTPHKKELSKLLGIIMEELSSAGTSLGVAAQCTEHNQMTFVLKDARTIVAQREYRYINVSGNDGMSTGGSGDVLCGIIVSLLAQGMSCYDAASLGVYVHGLAGDAAAEQKGHRSMLAGDIIEGIAYVLRGR